MPRRTHTQRALMTSLAMLAASHAAHATGSFQCEIDDAAVKFTGESAFSTGLGAGFLGFAGALELRAKEAPNGLSDLKLGPAELVHHWFAGDELKLHLYREREGDAPHGYIELIVETKRTPDDETQFAGTYSLRSYDTAVMKNDEAQTLSHDGKATCSVE